MSSADFVSAGIVASWLQALQPFCGNPGAKLLYIYYMVFN